MKKDIILFVAIFIVLSMIAGGTYAYWQWVNARNTTVVFNTVSSDISKYIVYDAGESHFVGNFEPSSTFCDGMSNTISFYKKSEITNQNLVATIKMNINAIGENIKNSEYVYWLLTSGDSESCTGILSDALAYGTFKDIAANTTITLKSNIEMTTSNQMFTIWIWVDSAGSGISSLSGETIDVNIWSQIDMGDIPEYGLYDSNGNFTKWDELLYSGLIGVNGTSFDYIDIALSGELVIPNSITNISDFACQGASLTSVVIPDSVTSMGIGVFDGSSLTSVVIPRSITNIPEGVFSATQLMNVYYEGTESEWSSIIIGSYNTELTSATIHYNYTG